MRGALVLLGLLPALLGAAPAVPVAGNGPSLVAFECGRLAQDLAPYNDTYRFDGQKREFVAGCFVIRHPKGVLLWDTGLGPALLASGEPGLTAGTPLVDRLRTLGLSPGDVTYVGISHYHADHTGGALAFAGSTLLIGAADLDRLRAMKRDDPDRAGLTPWLDGGAKAVGVRGDHDVFGDGSVVMLDLPGHTPGHHGLLVRLAHAGPVLLTGDEYHFRENRAARGVPVFNTSRAQTLASHDRLEGVAQALGARVVIQHDMRDLRELPPFPKALD